MSTDAEVGESKSKARIWRALGLTFFYIHGLPMIPMFLYFSWQFAQEHGFAAYLMFGEVVPIMKSVIWEYYVLRACLG